MASVPAFSRYQTGELFKALLRQRAQQCVIVLDVNLEVALVDPRALALLETHFQLSHPMSTLPSLLQEAVCELVRRWSEKGADCERLAVTVEGLVLRVVPMLAPQGSFYAVFFEKEAWREDLREAVGRFSFTAREVEVLSLILDGLNAAEIAESLHIAEVTVFDHFKHISHKTKARNRADMLAKIFNWQSGLKTNDIETDDADCWAAYR